MKKLTILAAIMATYGCQNVSTLPDGGKYYPDVAMEIKNLSPTQVKTMIKIWNDDLIDITPSKLDEMTTLNRAFYAYPNNELTMNYYFEIDRGVYNHTLKEAKSYKLIVTKDIKKSLCANPDTRTLLEADILAKYTYSDQDGEFLFGVEVIKDDCK